MRTTAITLALTIGAAGSVYAQDSVRTFRGLHHTGISAVAFSSDGRRLATAGYDSTAILWDVTTGDSVRRFRAWAGISTMALSPDSRTLAVSVLGSLVLIDIAAGDAPSVPMMSNVFTMAFSPDSRLLAVGSAYDRTVHVVEMATRDIRATLLGHGGERLSLFRFNEAGTRLLVVSVDYARGSFLRLWDTGSWRTAWNLRTQQVTADARFTPLGDSIVLSGRAPDGSRRPNSIVTRSAVTGAETRALDLGTERPVSALSADARKGAVTDGDVTILDMSAGTAIRELPSAPKFCGVNRQGTGGSEVKFSPDGRHIVTYGLRRPLIVWNVESGARVATMESTATPQPSPFEWTVLRASQLPADASTPERLVRVELELKNTRSDRQSFDKWDPFACLWVDGKPYQSRGREILVDMAAAESVADRLRTSLSASETMVVDLTVAPGVTAGKLVTPRGTPDTRWELSVSPGSVFRIGVAFPTPPPGASAAEIETNGSRKRVTLPPLS